ncbi:MAG: AAA family ATPase [Thermodesulfobacteriota bacterium]
MSDSRKKYGNVINEFFEEDKDQEPQKEPPKEPEKPRKKPTKKEPKKVKKKDPMQEDELLNKLTSVIGPDKADTINKLIEMKIDESNGAISRKAAIMLVTQDIETEAAKATSTKKKPMKTTTNEKEVNSFLENTVVQPKSTKKKVKKKPQQSDEPEVIESPTEKPPSRRATKAVKTPPFAKAIVTDVPPIKYMTPEDVPKGDVWTIYGSKGSGKTSLAMSFPGELVVVQFDETSSIVWEQQFNCDPRIKIVDVTSLADFDDPITFLESSNRIMGYVNEVMNDVKKNGGVDRVILDNVEVYMEYAENAMRYYHNLKMSEGFSEFAYWKTRNMFLKQLHAKSYAVAKQGVIYTTYPFIEETIKRFGKSEKTKKPRWKDAIEKNTQNLVEVFYEESENENKYYVYTESMKRGYKNGKTVDITTPDNQSPRGWEILQKYKI